MRPAVLYDADCGFCQRSVRIVQWLRLPVDAVSIADAESNSEEDFEPNLTAMVDAGCDVTFAVGFNFSINDVTHTLHYLLKILDNMQRLDAQRGGATEP